MKNVLLICLSLLSLTVSAVSEIKCTFTYDHYLSLMRNDWINTPETFKVTPKSENKYSLWLDYGFITSVGTVSGSLELDGDNNLLLFQADDGGKDQFGNEHPQTFIRQEADGSYSFGTYVELTKQSRGWHTGKGTCKTIL